MLDPEPEFLLFPVPLRQKVAVPAITHFTRENIRHFTKNMHVHPSKNQKANMSSTTSKPTPKVSPKKRASITFNHKYEHFTLHHNYIVRS
jgi:hypothetical protein